MKASNPMQRSPRKIESQLKSTSSSSVQPVVLHFLEHKLTPVQPKGHLRDCVVCSVRDGSGPRRRSSMEWLACKKGVHGACALQYLPHAKTALKEIIEIE